MTTINRKIRKAANKVLMRYGIDDLQLEIDITSAVKDALIDDLVSEIGKPKGALAALQANEELKERVNVDISHYPEEVSGAILALCNLWMLTPPGRKSKMYSSWIECARDLIEACAEIPTNVVLQNVYADYMTQTSQNDGQAPYIVSGPCALIKVCRAKAGQLRQANFKSGESDDNNTGSSSFNF